MLPKTGSCQKDSEVNLNGLLLASDGTRIMTASDCILKLKNHKMKKKKYYWSSERLVGHQPITLETDFKREKIKHLSCLSYTMVFHGNQTADKKILFF